MGLLVAHPLASTSIFNTNSEKTQDVGRKGYINI